MAIVYNFPVRIPYPSQVGMLGQTFIAKAIISADTLLVTDTNDEFFYNLLLNDSADADTASNIPCFILPTGTMIEDIGIENFQVWTESASLIFGDSNDSDGWVDTLAFVATDTNAAGVINWMHGSISARMFLSVSTADASDVALTSTTITPAYIARGPRAMIGGGDSANFYSTVALVVGLDTDDEPGFGEYQIHVHQKGAVAITGGLAVYLKYNFAGLQIREPSSDLGLVNHA